MQPMERTVMAHLEIDVTTPATLAVQVAVARAHLDAGSASEALTLTANGNVVTPREIVAAHGARMHVVQAPTGPLTLDYWASVRGRLGPAPVDEVDLLRYLRPSRYCQSDTLGPTAHAEFGGLAPCDLLAAVSSWVGTRLAYVPGSSLPTDGATRTLLARRGVCRDFAHLVVALLRALDVPARLVSVYAPGLDPMDFHAVAEAHVAGQWHVVDATTLAPRSTMVRIATGLDTSDTAFLSVYHGTADLRDMSVGAIAGSLPGDDVTELVTLG